MGLGAQISGWLRLIAAVLVLTQATRADTFIVREDDGNTAYVEARLIGQSRGAIALERNDGRIEVVPRQQILKREVGPDPEPVSCETIIARLQAEFGEDRFRAASEPPYVVGLVLSEPLPNMYEANATNCLTKGAAFMKTVEKVFLDFVNDLKIETENPRYPLVFLIFETDDDFLKCATVDTGGRGLSARSISGYYNELTNRLVIRMGECNTFITPLHEAVHQQAFNRGLIRRLAPIPAWFNEGIATGFEGNGEKINGGPLKIHPRYARSVFKAKTVDWDDVVADDKAFRGDVLAGEAYANAWSIHWFLLTKYRKQYIEYLKILGQKSALEVDDADTRNHDFEQSFGKRVGQLQSEFPEWLDQMARKQKISLREKDTVGPFSTQMNLAKVDILMAKAGVDGHIKAEGRMMNISQIRPMSFLVTLETDTGTYAEWYLPNVAPTKTTPLPRQTAQKRMKGGPGGPAATYRVKVRAAVPESELGKSWQKGQFPVPVWNDG